MRFFLIQVILILSLFQPSAHGDDDIEKERAALVRLSEVLPDNPVLNEILYEAIDDFKARARGEYRPVLDVDSEAGLLEHDEYLRMIQVLFEVELRAQEKSRALSCKSIL